MMENEYVAINLKALIGKPVYAEWKKGEDESYLEGIFEGASVNKSSQYGLIGYTASDTYKISGATIPGDATLTFHKNDAI